MNHQPFRDWVLTKEKLSADQIHEMEEHLLSCESCRQTEAAWLQVESTFRSVPQVQPEPGFTNRWKAHLAEHLELKRKHRSWLMIGLNLVVILFFFGLVIAQLWSLFQAPEPYLADWFNQIFSLVTIYYTLLNIFQSLSLNLPLISFIGIFFMVGIISFMSVLWLATYRKLSYARRLI